MILELVRLIKNEKTHGRSQMRTIHDQITQQDKAIEVAEVVIQQTAYAVYEVKPVLNAARSISTRIHNLLQIEYPTEEPLLKVGIFFLDLMARMDLIDTEKHLVAEDGQSAKESWFIVSASEDFTNYSQAVSPSSSMVPVNNGPYIWRRPTLHTGGQKVPLVKKAERYGILNEYTEEAMPNVYSALNRLNRQPFKINRSILSLTEETEGLTFCFIPPKVSEDDRKVALRSINDVARKAKFIEEVRFKEMHKWLLEEAEVEDEDIASSISKKRAKEKSNDYFDTKAEEHLEVISNWSKRLSFERAVQLAHLWKDSSINYLFNMDTRGRIYSVQNYLTPLGEDFAKACLLFGEEQQVSGYDLCVHIANCFGEDKLSFSDRVEWVNKNSMYLYKIGEDPIRSTEIIEALGLQKEKKTKWQGIAACIEYKRYVDYVNDNKTEEGFTTALIVGLDATASGTQLLSILGRDNKVAPYVNITAPTTDRVGDFYTFLSNYLRPKLELHRGTSETLDAILDDWSGYARKLAKRNSMTFSYSGTKFGFGEQHWQDRKDYGEAGEKLTRYDCRIIGNEMYDVCVENIRGGAEIMKWLREGIDLHKGGSMISWTLPDGFKAFQVCDRSQLRILSCEIGTRKINLGYYVFTDKPNKSEHKNGIAPNWVHSYDSYLLRLIVNGLPDEAPISTVHDQFSTSSYHIEELQSVAKTAYKLVGCRDTAERMCEEAFGEYRQLPMVGNWNLNEIDKAEFIIC